MIKLCAKFEVYTFTHCENKKGDKNTEVAIGSYGSFEDIGNIAIG